MRQRAVAVALSVALGLAVTSIEAARPKADYRFQGVYTSDVGTPPALADLGPGTNSFVTVTVDGVSRQVLAFPLHNGVELPVTTGVVPNGSYTIAIFAELDVITGVRRLADFKNGHADSGFYDNGGHVGFLPLTTGAQPVVLANGTFHQYVLTRDAASGQLAGYVDGLPSFAVADPDNLGVIGAAHVLRFFRDNDSGGTTGEDTAGQVARIRLYGTPLDAESVAQLDWLPDSPRHEATKDFAFTPRNVLPTLGGKVEWNFYGPSSHTASDASGMALFDSGAKGSGQLFRQQFTAAGSYPFRCNIHPSMTGTVKVPMTVQPKTGSSTTSFTVRWARITAPAGFVYDVQIQRPSDSSFVDFLAAQTDPAHGFTPDGGAGTYQFRSRLRRLAGGASGYSDPLVLKVN